jgi:hypothetical protein
MNLRKAAEMALAVPLEGHTADKSRSAATLEAQRII